MITLLYVSKAFHTTFHFIVYGAIWFDTHSRIYEIAFKVAAICKIFFLNRVKLYLILITHAMLFMNDKFAQSVQGVPIFMRYFEKI